MNPEQQPSKLEKLYVPIAIVVAGLIMAGGLFLGAKSVTRVISPLPGGVANQTMQAGSMRPISASDHIIGNPNADIVIVEYSDTECPFCKSFYSTLQQIMKDYGTSGKVAWVYRQFPIADLHKRAPKEAEATECAYDQGGNDAFWKYLTEVYDKTNSNDTLDPAQLPKIASDISLDVNVFNTCLSSGKFTAKVQADYDNAVASGGQGTPHTIIVTKDGGKLPIEGETTYANLKSTIDLLLGKTAQ